MQTDADVIIVGGGLNGPALALALARAGLRVTVIDAQPARARAGDAFDGRAYALAVRARRRMLAEAEDRAFVHHPVARQAAPTGG